jgi:uncharacterized protein YcbK (DUF882 family)
MLRRLLKSRLGDYDENIELSRRRFIRHVAYGAIITLGLPTIAQASKGRIPIHKSLAFEINHTGEKLKLTYFEKGRYIKAALREINFALRDFRTGTIHPIDIALLDLLHDLKLMLGINNRPFNIISGYRSPYTNAILHHEDSGVATNSLHIQGRAVDMRLAGYDSRHIRNAALAMQRGGVGYYHESDFVHLDTGKFRTW